MESLTCCFAALDASRRPICCGRESRLVLTLGRCGLELHPLAKRELHISGDRIRGSFALCNQKRFESPAEQTGQRDAQFVDLDDCRLSRTFVQLSRSFF